MASRGRLGFLASPLETTSVDELPRQGGWAQGLPAGTSDMESLLGWPWCAVPAQCTLEHPGPTVGAKLAVGPVPMGPGQDPTLHPSHTHSLPRSWSCSRAVSPSWASHCLAGCPESLPRNHPTMQPRGLVAEGLALRALESWRGPDRGVPGSFRSLRLTAADTPSHSHIPRGFWYPGRFDLREALLHPE